MKPLISGLAIAGACVATFYLIKIAFFLIWICLPFLILAAVFYTLGNFVPKGTRESVVAYLRKGFDWCDFNAPHFTWPLIKMARVALDWLGLKIKAS